jgi:hypothetical protein
VRVQLGAVRQARARLAPAALSALLIVAGAASPAAAEDRFDSTVTWFQERRADGNSLTVVHPQVDVGVDLGNVLSLGAGYQADVVTGASPSIYAAPRPGDVDAVSTASEFSDTRHVASASLGLTGSRSSLEVSYRYGTERDYRSHSIGASGSIDLPGKNTTFGLSYGRSIDRVCNYDNGDAEPLARRPLSGQNGCFTDDPAARTVSLPLDVDAVQASLTQNVTPTLVLQLGLYGQIVRGFQANPYRRVRVFDIDAQESVPEVRDRGAVFLRMNLALPGLHAATSLFVRGYSDTWGITSGSVEVTYHQYLGRRILFRLRGRGYQQSAAVFFRDATAYALIGPAGRYFTGDREHAPLRTALAGGKLSYIVTSESGKSVLGLFDEVDFHLSGETLWTVPMTETAPGGDASGVMPDALIAELGMLLRY